ncbi:hypothetical protein N836_06455 [Leptolyngbya sp. Heron Island J]|nr:hypothetical protein N836_06455 [Leptolyngbya sp. Heron Island J]
MGNPFNMYRLNSMPAGIDAVLSYERQELKSLPMRNDLIVEIKDKQHSD